MPLWRLFQYQAKTEPARQPEPRPESWIQPWSLPKRFAIAPALAVALGASGGVLPPQPPTAAVQTVAPPSTVSITDQRGILYQAHVEPVLVPSTAIDGAVAYAAANVNVSFPRITQYQTLAQPVTTPTAEVITEDKWHQPWSSPVRKPPRVAQFANLAWSTFTPAVAATATAPISAVSIVDRRGILYPSHTEPVTTPTVETVTVDKWIYPWSVPTRLNARAQYQQFTTNFLFTPNAVPLPEFYISEIFSSYFHYQSKTEPVTTPSAEVITEDKWHQPWSVPVRAAQRDVWFQYLAWSGFTPAPEVITEDKWHQAWSRPVRVLPRTAWFQDLAWSTFTPAVVTATAVAPVSAVSIVDRRGIIYPAHTEPATVPVVAAVPALVDSHWSEPVLANWYDDSGLVIAGTGLETITEDKWHQPWSQPVRVKPGLPATQQQVLAWNTLTPPSSGTATALVAGMTEATLFDRRGILYQSHVEPSRVVAEIITADKWTYPWSEPVRQKPGLAASLQQSLIATTLNPDTQITQNFESRWHQAWSEPVRVRPHLRTGTQQTLAAPTTVFETITVDKWIYPWRDPVREKIGLKAHLQQALIAPVLDPNTQITQTFESRWHQAWSEPVRSRQFPAAQQQGVIGPATSVFEVITVDKWIYPWTDPVRDKIGLKAHLQQAFIGTVLNPDTQITQTYESRWHQPWSLPVRAKVIDTRQFYAAPITVAEIVTVDKWIYPWSEPNVKSRRPAPWYQPFAADTTVIPISKLETWFSPLSEPSVKYLRPAAWYQPFTTDTTVIPVSRMESLRHQPWSEPLRRLPGLAPHLQQFTTPAVPVFPNLQRTIPWFGWLSEPVRVRIGLTAPLQEAFTYGQVTPAAAAITLTLSATEVNTDSALFGMVVYNGPVTANVSIKEIKVVDRAAVSIKES